MIKFISLQVSTILLFLSFLLFSENNASASCYDIYISKPTMMVSSEPNLVEQHDEQPSMEELGKEMPVSTGELVSESSLDVEPVAPTSDPNLITPLCSGGGYPSGWSTVRSGATYLNTTSSGTKIYSKKEALQRQVQISQKFQLEQQ